MPSPRHSKSPLWLHLVLVVAAMAVLSGVVDLVAALVTGALPFGQYVHQLFLPLGLTLLGLSSWLLARPRLYIRPNALPVPRLLSGLIALFGVVCAVFAGAELASAFADAGLVVLLDASLMFVALAGVILGVWCAIAGTTNLARSSRSNAP
jgi:hypothetical protein